MAVVELVKIKNEKLRFVAGFVSAPLVGAAVFLGYPLLLHFQGVAFEVVVHESSIGWARFEVPLSYSALATLGWTFTAMLLGGIPFYLLFRRLGWLGPFYLGAAGAMTGLFTILGAAEYLGWAFLGFEGPGSHDKLLVLASFCGAVSGLVFWFIVLRGGKETG